MITVLTTVKPFRGQDRINQLNAVRCWLSEKRVGEVVVFGQPEGFEELGFNSKLRIVHDFPANENGVPFVSEFFHWAAEHAQFEYCMVSNADILYPQHFWSSLLDLSKRMQPRPFLVVGERVNVRVEKLLEFDDGWSQRFDREYGTNHMSNGPAHSDYFFFPKKQYEQNRLPELLIGRPGWDRFMFYHARKCGIRCVDFTYTAAPWHQMHDYAHKPKDEKKRDAEDEFNLRVFPKKHKYLFLLDTCDYVFVANSILRSYAKGNLKKAYIQELVISPNLIRRIIVFFKFRLLFLGKLINMPKNYSYIDLNRLGKAVLKHKYFDEHLDSLKESEPLL